MNLVRRLIGLSELLSKFGFIPSALTRLTLGVIFAGSGWGKLQNMDRTIEFFGSIGVPMPQYQAPLAAAVELVCGAMIALGLMTRLAAMPLIIVMLVAIRTAKWEEVTDLQALLGMSEYLYIVLLLWIATQGAGRVSVDAILNRRSTRK